MTTFGSLCSGIEAASVALKPLGFGTCGAGWWREGIGPFRARDNGYENLTVCSPTVFGIPGNWIGRKPENGGNATEPHVNRSPCLTSTDRHAVAYGLCVRRLMPVECGRLQGFPDGHTQIPWRGKPASECPDGPQYAAYGNSMAVPCVAWIGKRILRQLTCN